MTRQTSKSNLGRIKSTPYSQSNVSQSPLIGTPQITSFFGPKCFPRPSLFHPRHKHPARQSETDRNGHTETPTQTDTNTYLLLRHALAVEEELVLFQPDRAPQHHLVAILIAQQAFLSRVEVGGGGGGGQQRGDKVGEIWRFSVGQA